MAAIVQQPRSSGVSPGINPLQILYGFYVVDPADGTLVQLWPSALVWEEQTGEFSVRVTATFPNIETPSGWVHQLVALGGHAVLNVDWGAGPTEVWRGQIWHWTFTDNGREEVVAICYDRLMYLQRSKDSKSYNLGVDPMGVAFPSTDPTLLLMPTISSGAIMDDLARRWSFTVLNTNRLTRLMPSMVWTQTALSQMFSELLDRTYWLGGGAFVLRSDHDQIQIVSPATNTPIYLLTRDLLSRYSDEQSIENLVTRVVVLGMLNAQTGGFDPIADPNNYLVPIEGVLDGLTEYGIMQDIIQDPGQNSQSDLAQLAKQTIGDRGQPQRVQHFDAPDLPFLRRGDAIAVQAGTLNGIYVITGISHDAGQRRMQITVDTSGNLTDPSVLFTVNPAISVPTNPPMIGLPPVAVGRVGPPARPNGGLPR